jgi:hypothetical protein
LYRTVVPIKAAITSSESRTLTAFDGDAFVIAMVVMLFFYSIVLV